MHTRIISVLLSLGFGLPALAEHSTNVKVGTVERFVCTTGVKSESVDRREYGYCANAHGVQFNMPMHAFQPHFKFEDVRMVKHYKVFYCYLWKKDEQSSSLLCRFEASTARAI